MANTFTFVSGVIGERQFQGLYSDTCKIDGTVDDQDAIADDVSVDLTLTVPGLLLADAWQKIGVSFTKSQSDANAGISADAWVSADNTVTLRLVNIDATTDAYDADTLTGGRFKILLGKPAW